MSKNVELIILGEPMGKQRPRFSTYNGFVKTHTPKETINYESMVVHEYRQKYDKMVFDQNSQLIVTIYALFPITKQHYKFHKKTNTIDLDKVGQEMVKGNIKPTKKPDCDNVAKIVLDALNGIAYPDDSQVVSLCVRKFYTDQQARVVLEIKEYETTIS